MSRCICTICTDSHLPGALALWESVQRHGPGWDFLALRISESGLPKNVPAKFAAACVSITAASLPHPGMAFWYDAFELCNAAKGLLHKYMLEQTPHDEWWYIDSDCAFYSTLDPLSGLFDGRTVALSPHRKVPPLNAQNIELRLLAYGVFNGGMLGLRRTSHTSSLVEWLLNRMTWFSFSRPDKGLFVDQKWLELIPLYFPASAITHPGVNIGHWNMDEYWPANNVQVPPPLLAHFSQIDWLAAPLRINTPPHAALPIPDAFASLMREYAACVHSWKTLLGPSAPYPYKTFRDGIHIQPVMRAACYCEIIRIARTFDPFADSGRFAGLNEQAVWAALDKLLAPEPLVPASPLLRPLKEPQLAEHLRNRLKELQAKHALRKIALFGAGAHTRWLESVMKGVAGLLEVTNVLDDDPHGKPSAFGRTPSSAQAFNPAGLDAIVLSTDCHQAAMRKRCMDLYGSSILLIDLYEKLPPGPYVKTSAPGPDEYEVSAEYFAAVLEWNRSHSAVQDQAFLEKLDGYHLSCNRHGRLLIESVAERLKPFHRSFAGARVLDIGCGTGGTLYGAACLDAAWCEGWEINDAKLRLGTLNVTTLPRTSCRSRIHLRQRDILEAGIEKESFDIVLCQEVLEHVKDVRLAIKNLSACLRAKAGIAYVSVPNGFSIQHILRDPHLLLFGLGLLDLPDAAALALAINNHAHYGTMMGQYLSFNQYTQEFEAAGLASRALHPTKACTREDLVQGAQEIEAAWRQKREEWATKIPGTLLDRLAQRVGEYLTKLRGLANTPESPLAQESFIDSFEFFLSHHLDEETSKQSPHAHNDRVCKTRAGAQDAIGNHGP